MDLNPEQRNKTRFPYETPITLENNEIGILHGARMFDYSETGLYFESDYLIRPGTELFIGITSSPYASEPDVCECYRAEIRWRKSLKKSAFFYGYGAQFLEIKQAENEAHRDQELRKHPRKACSIQLKYVSQNKLGYGKIKNISLGGIFLKTTNNTSVGQQMHLTIPVRKKRKVVKRVGKIIWSNRLGVGIQFQRSEKK